MKLECLILIFVQLLDGFECEKGKIPVYQDYNLPLYEGSFINTHTRFVNWQDADKKAYGIPECKRIHQYRNKLFGRPELFEPVGKHKYRHVKCEVKPLMADNVVIRSDAESLHMSIDKERKFPTSILKCECYIPKAKEETTADFKIALYAENLAFIMNGPPENGDWYIHELWRYVQQ